MSTGSSLNAAKWRSWIRRVKVTRMACRPLIYQATRLRRCLRDRRRGPSRARAGRARERAVAGDRLGVVGHTGLTADCGGHRTCMVSHPGWRSNSLRGETERWAAANDRVPTTWTGSPGRRWTLLRGARFLAGRRYRFRGTLGRIGFLTCCSVDEKEFALNTLCAWGLSLRGTEAPSRARARLRSGEPALAGPQRRRLHRGDSRASSSSCRGARRNDRDLRRRWHLLPRQRGHRVQLSAEAHSGADCRIDTSDDSRPQHRMRPVLSRRATRWWCRPPMGRQSFW